MPSLEPLESRTLARCESNILGLRRYGAYRKVRPKYRGILLAQSERLVTSTVLIPHGLY